jgi:integrating conjugative element protein (TIGR03757 family)
MKNIVFMMISLMSVQPSAMAWSVEVFTTSAHPVSLNGVHASVCELDALDHITNDLNRKGVLHPDFEQDFELQHTPLTLFYRCQNQAMSYELKSLPAIVMNQSYVVYGVDSVEKALMLLRHHQEVAHG